MPISIICTCNLWQCSSFLVSLWTPLSFPMAWAMRLWEACSNCGISDCRILTLTISSWILSISVRSSSPQNQAGRAVANFSFLKISFINVLSRFCRGLQNPNPAIYVIINFGFTLPWRWPQNTANILNNTPVEFDRRSEEER